MIIQLDLLIEGRQWEKDVVPVGTIQYIKQDGQTSCFLDRTDAEPGKTTTLLGFQEVENGDFLAVLLVFDYHTEMETYYVYDSRKSLKTGNYILEKVEEGLRDFKEIINKHM
ncbi:hypothetical protein ACQUY5_29295 [Bacillus cereus]|uniref:hypothetical protein n=1 Tax=Bacillus cereus TaxID=1396 RepID=UPI003D16EEBC